MRSAGWNLENTYAELPSLFFSKLAPVQVAGPKLLLLNETLARTLGLDLSVLREEAPLLFSGNALPQGSIPLAQAYAGHQYGHFTRLGDGRAILLGEQIDPLGRRWDIQLKGSGQTPYSRRGDGRAALGPMLREYLISEAMAALRIPTTRSLAVVSTGEAVYRETALPGAVLTRVAASHIRVGTFEYAAAHGLDVLRSLADYVIERHYPDLRGVEARYALLLRAILLRQAKLAAQWMHVGFVHGVMNTDNMAISGETIDYGPCAFMDQYDPQTVFSSIDRDGRYAYRNQPLIAHWNLTRLAEAMLPLFDEREDAAIAIAQKELEHFSAAFSEEWRTGMRAKLGLFESRAEDDQLAEELLNGMFTHHLDFTNTFRALAVGQTPRAKHTEDFADFWKHWHMRWETRRAGEGRPLSEAQTLMQNSSPSLIPRNHHVEAALTTAVAGDLAPFHKLLSALERPFEDRTEHLPYLDPAPPGGERYQTYCGT